MSFSKTVSVVAALGSIFSVGLASWKISEDIKNGQTAPLEEKIQELEKKLEESKSKQPITSIPAPVALPPTQTSEPVTLPPVTPPPPVESQQ